MDTLTMRPDVRTWVEAGIAYHLKRGVPVDDLPRMMVGRVLAQLLFLLRRDVPDQWSDGLSEADFSLVARNLEMTRSVDTQLPEFASCAHKVQAALERADWQSIRALPEVAWRWVVEMSGLDRDDWESIPSIVRAALESQFVCPVCQHMGQLAESARVSYSLDPFDWSSSNATHLTCRKCAAHLVYDVATGKAKQWGQTWRRMRIALFVLVGFVLLFTFVTLWRH